jgi:hypothetical protein
MLRSLGCQGRYLNGHGLLFHLTNTIRSPTIDLEDYLARRPIFLPFTEGPPFCTEVEVDFFWFPGMAKSQAQKSIASLHQAAGKMGLVPLLEISSKATSSLGVALSAFNLRLMTLERYVLSVECAFQGSKVFEQGGPFIDLYTSTSREAKTDPRIRDSGELVSYNFFGEEFPRFPGTAFYNWLYLRALMQNPQVADKLTSYAGYTDIAFNPKKSWNCQARAAAVFVALNKVGILEEVVASKNAFLEAMGEPRANVGAGQMSLGFE